MSNSVKSTKRSGKNVWVSFYDDTDFVKSQTRPEGYVPAYPKSRLTRGGYIEYTGGSEWEQAANKAMAKAGRN